MTQTETESCSQKATAIIGAITTMAQIVEGSVDRVIGALLARDAKLTDNVFETEQRINELEIQLDELVVAALCANNLAEEDVRLMVASLKISNDLERMGDLAINIGQRVIALSGQAGVENPPELQPMAIAVSHMCRKVLRALIYRDLALAMLVLESDDLVDNFRDHVYQTCEIA